MFIMVIAHAHERCFLLQEELDFTFYEAVLSFAGIQHWVTLVTSLLVAISDEKWAAKKPVKRVLFRRRFLLSDYSASVRVFSSV